jgi:hypothetical protein
MDLDSSSGFAREGEEGVKDEECKLDIFSFLSPQSGTRALRAIFECQTSDALTQGAKTGKGKKNNGKGSSYVDSFCQLRKQKSSEGEANKKINKERTGCVLGP